MIGTIAFMLTKLLITEGHLTKYVIHQTLAKTMMHRREKVAPIIANLLILLLKNYIIQISTKQMHVHSLGRREILVRRENSVHLYTFKLSKDIFHLAKECFYMID